MGGKEANKHKAKRDSSNSGTRGKTIVMGLVQKDGEIRAGVIESAERENLEGVIGAHVVKGSTVVTDMHVGYNRLGRQGYDHQRVNHTDGQYVNADGFSTNSVESLWALFKRQYHGTHHFISTKHMDAYLGEMTFRLNRRDLKKGDLVNALLARAEGPLSYKVLIA